MTTTAERRQAQIHIELLRPIGRRKRAALMRELRDMQPIIDVTTFLRRVEADIWVFRSARAMEPSPSDDPAYIHPWVSRVQKGAALRRERAERRIERAVLEFAEEIMRTRECTHKRIETNVGHVTTCLDCGSEHVDVD